jgi:hypothetical protein
MSQAIASEVYVRVHDSGRDITPSQYLHRNAGEVCDHGRQAHDVEEDGGFEEIDEMPCALSTRFGLRFALLDPEIGR